MALKLKDGASIDRVQRQAVEILRVLDEHGPNGTRLLHEGCVTAKTVERCHEIAAGDEVLARDEYTIGVAYLDSVGRLALGY